MPFASAKPPMDQYSTDTMGDGYRLAIKGGRITFCDNSGEKQLDLSSGKQSATGSPCAPEDLETDTNRACQWPDVDAAVMYSFTEPNDKVEFDTFPFSLKGRVWDCAHDGKMLVVSTGKEGRLLDGDTGRSVRFSDDGAGDVAIGSGWIAWCTHDRKRVRALRQSTAWASLPVTAPAY